MVHGIKMELLENTVQSLKDLANLSDEMCEDLRDIQYQYKRNNNKITTHRLISGNNINYVLVCIVMIRNKLENTFSYAYASQNLDIKVGTVQVINTFRQARLNGFTTKELLNTYLEYKAMERFQKRGIIHAINYVN